MWVSEEYFITDLIKKDVFKAEFFDEHFAASLIGVQKYKLVKIQDIVQVHHELIHPITYPEHLFNYLSLANITADTGELVDFKPMQGKEIKSQCKIFHEDDLLYGRLRSYLNKCYHAKGAVKEGICTTECIVISPDKNIVLPEYLHALLLSKFIQEQVNYIQTGSSRPRIQEETFLNLTIPLMPIDEQLVVAKLHTSMLELRHRKLVEREELLRFTRYTIEKMLLEESPQEIDLEQIPLPENPVFNNPLPEDFQPHPLQTSFSFQ